MNIDINKEALERAITCLCPDKHQIADIRAQLEEAKEIGKKYEDRYFSVSKELEEYRKQLAAVTEDRDASLREVAAMGHRIGSLNATEGR